MKTSKAALESIAKYNKDKTIQVCLRLNKKTDADIIAALESVSNKQGLIKALIREKIKESEL